MNKMGTSNEKFVPKLQSNSLRTSKQAVHSIQLKVEKGQLEEKKPSSTQAQVVFKLTL